MRLGNTDTTDAGMKHLAGLEKLETLDLETTYVTDDGMELLPSWPMLMSLDLRGTKIGNATLDT